ncbi:MAG: hypothetical protein V4805_09195 [Pseudomonadota bacterium]
MNDLNLLHQPTLNHHLFQAKYWLDASLQGENTANMSYAALELRFTIERLAVHYWATISNQTLGQIDLTDLKFDNVRRRVIEIAGHQKKINSHFIFAKILINHIKIDPYIHTPNLGDLHSFWSDCSEMCHIGWPLRIFGNEDSKIHFERLLEIARNLTDSIQSLSWPLFDDPEIDALRQKFIADKISAEVVVEYLNRKGVYAVFESNTGARQFIGEPVAPNSYFKAATCKES